MKLVIIKTNANTETVLQALNGVAHKYVAYVPKGRLGNQDGAREITDDHQYADKQKVNIRDSSELLPETFREPGDEGVLGGGDGVGVDLVAGVGCRICSDVGRARRLVVVDAVHRHNID